MTMMNRETKAVADDGFKIATEVLRVALKLVDFEAAARYCIDVYLGFDEK